MTTHSPPGDLPGIRDLARAVGNGAADPPLTARSAATLLTGAARLTALWHGAQAMHDACTDLVRCESAWATRFGVLPRGFDGRVAEPVVIMASMAAALLAVAPAEHVRAALAFWATERDPAVWRQVAAGTAA